MNKTDRRTFLKYLLGGAFGAALAPAAALRVEESASRGHPIKEDPTLEYWVQVPKHAQDDYSPIAYRVAKALPGDLATVVINDWPYPAKIKFKQDLNGYSLRLTIHEFFALGSFVCWSIPISETLAFEDVGYVTQIIHDRGSPEWEFKIVDAASFCRAVSSLNYHLDLYVRYEWEPERIRQKALDAIQSVTSYAWTQPAERVSRWLSGGYLFQNAITFNEWQPASLSWRALPRV